MLYYHADTLMCTPDHPEGTSISLLEKELQTLKQATKEVLGLEFNEEDTEALLNQIAREAYWIQLHNKLEKIL